MLGVGGRGCWVSGKCARLRLRQVGGVGCCWCEASLPRERKRRKQKAFWTDTRRTVIALHVWALFAKEMVCVVCACEVLGLFLLGGCGRGVGGLLCVGAGCLTRIYNLILRTTLW
jgi:hypothetical protein